MEANVIKDSVVSPFLFNSVQLELIGYIPNKKVRDEVDDLFVSIEDAM